MAVKKYCKQYEWQGERQKDENKWKDSLAYLYTIYKLSVWVILRAINELYIRILRNLRTVRNLRTLNTLSNLWKQMIHASESRMGLQVISGLAQGRLYLPQVGVAGHLCLCNHDGKVRQGTSRSPKSTLDFTGVCSYPQLRTISNWLSSHFGEASGWCWNLRMWRASSLVGISAFGFK